MSEGGVSLRCPGQVSVLRRSGQQVMEGLEDGGTTWDKVVIESDQTPKLAQLTLGTGLGELLDHTNFGGEGSYTVLVHVVAQELQGGNTKNTLGSIELDAVVLEACEDLAEVAQLLVLVLAGNQNVIQVSVAAGETTKDLVDEPLEGLQHSVNQRACR